MAEVAGHPAPEARARTRGGRGTSSSVGRVSRGREDHARATRAVDPSSSDARRVAGGDPHMERRRASPAGVRIDVLTAVAGAPPHRFPLGARGGRFPAPPGRGEPGPPRCPLPRRTSGVLPRLCRSTAAAAGGRHGDRQSPQRFLHVPGGLHAGGRHEPVPVRIPRTSPAHLPMCGRGTAALPAGPHRTPWGSHRPHGRGSPSHRGCVGRGCRGRVVGGHSRSSSGCPGVSSAQRGIRVQRIFVGQMVRGRHPRLLEKRLCMSGAGGRLLREALVRNALGGRGYVRVLAVSRTLADLAGECGHHAGTRGGSTCAPVGRHRGDHGVRWSCW